MSIRWKIVLLTMLVVFISIFLLNRFVIDYVDQKSCQAQEINMGHTARIVAGLHAAENTEPERFLPLIATEFGMQIQIISLEGMVLHDSEDPGEVGTNLVAREEVHEAIAAEYGGAWELTYNRDYNNFYVCIKSSHESTTAPFLVRVKQNTSPIIRAIGELQDKQNRAVLMALLVSGLVALLFGWTLARPLRNLTLAARRFASGQTEWTYQTRGRDEIAALGQSMQQMATEIEERNVYNREFMQVVTHELRSPLTAIRGASEILGETDDPVARTKFTNNILAETDRTIRLVSQLAELTRLDTHSLRGQKETRPFGAFVASLIDRLDLPATFSNPEPDLDIAFVPDHIEQVLVNLIENANRYTTAPATVELIAEAEQLIISVQDDGPGISEEDLPHVFDRFYSTVERVHGDDFGHGLGLTIARTIVEQHGGSIRAENRSGARISFTLPFAT